MYKILTFLLVISIVACKKEPTPPAVVTVPEKLEITPTSASIMRNNTTTLTVKYFNNLGVLATTPTTIVWSSGNNSIATVTNAGVVTGIAAGQATIKVALGTVEATALITVTDNANQIAAINITPSGIIELTKNQTATLTATAVNQAGTTIPGLTYSWTSGSNTIASTANGGVITGLTYGSTSITATANNIMSAPSMVQVIRKGQFSGQGSAGFAKLKLVNNVLQLETTTDFSISTGAPDLRMYLTNTPNTITGAVQVADLARPAQYSGMHTFNIAAPTTINDYRYVIVWCAQFGGNYGTADLGQ